MRKARSIHKELCHKKSLCGLVDGIFVVKFSTVDSEVNCVNCNRIMRPVKKFKSHEKPKS